MYTVPVKIVEDICSWIHFWSSTYSLIIRYLTVLTISSQFLCRDITALLLGHDKWKEMMRSSLGETTLMRELITYMPGKLGLISHPQFW